MHVPSTPSFLMGLLSRCHDHETLRVLAEVSVAPFLEPLISTQLFPASVFYEVEPNLIFVSDWRRPAIQLFASWFVGVFECWFAYGWTT